MSTCWIFWINGHRYKGTFCNQDVAIKVLRAEHLNETMQREFFQEVYIMRFVVSHLQRSSMSLKDCRYILVIIIMCWLFIQKRPGDLAILLVLSQLYFPNDIFQRALSLSDTITFKKSSSVGLCCLLKFTLDWYLLWPVTILILLAFSILGNL